LSAVAALNSGYQTTAVWDSLRACGAYCGACRCALAPRFECGEHAFGIMIRGPCALCRSPFDLSDADLRRLRDHEVLQVLTHVGSVGQPDGEENEHPWGQRLCSAGCSLLRHFCPTNMRRGDRRTRRRSLRNLDAKSRRGHLEHIMYGSASASFSSVRRGRYPE
jgi:hypothetical protein